MNFNPTVVQIGYIAELCGIWDNNFQKRDQLIRRPHKLDGIRIPTSFDAREEWVDCPSLFEIGDQGYCGSDWVKKTFLKEFSGKFSAF